MYDTTVYPNIATIRRALEATGEKFPKPVLTALAEHDKIEAASREFQPATRDQVAAAVAECLLADRDPADDDTVRRLVTSHALSDNGAAGYGIDLTPQATARVVAALTREADAVIALLAPHADKAGADLARADDLLRDEDDPQLIMSRGVEAVEAWTAAQHATKLLDLIGGAWVALANLTGFASPSSYPILRLTEADLDVYDQAGRRADPRAIIRAGGRIALADRETFAQRSADLIDLMNTRASQPARDTDAAIARRFSFHA